MPRIVGIDIPKEKKIYVSLQYIYGIGETSAKKILQVAGINPDVRSKNLTDEEVNKIHDRITEKTKAEFNAVIR